MSEERKSVRGRAEGGVAVKPREFINAAREHIAQSIMFTPRFELLSAIGQAHASLTAVVHYLDEEAERRAKFEADVLDRLTKLERKTSSTEFVTLHEEPRDLGNGWSSGKSYRVRWHEPYPERPTATPEVAVHFGGTPCVNGKLAHDLRGLLICPDCGYRPSVARVGDLVSTGDINPAPPSKGAL